MRDAFEVDQRSHLLFVETGTGIDAGIVHGSTSYELSVTDLRAPETALGMLRRAYHSTLTVSCQPRIFPRFAFDFPGAVRI
jgi:hypothetical protein